MFPSYYVVGTNTIKRNGIFKFCYFFGFVSFAFCYFCILFLNLIKATAAQRRSEQVAFTSVSAQIGIADVDLSETTDANYVKLTITRHEIVNCLWFCAH